MGGECGRGGGGAHARHIRGAPRGDAREEVAAGGSGGRHVLAAGIQVALHRADGHLALVAAPRRCLALTCQAVCRAPPLQLPASLPTLPASSLARSLLSSLSLAVQYILYFVTFSRGHK